MKIYYVYLFIIASLTFFCVSYRLSELAKLLVAIAGTLIIFLWLLSFFGLGPWIEVHS